eukprot:5288522-Pleurochrysis_carterae.AAC.1
MSLQIRRRPQDPRLAPWIPVKIKLPETVDLSCQSSPERRRSSKQEAWLQAECGCLGHARAREQRASRKGIAPVRPRNRRGVGVAAYIARSSGAGWARHYLLSYLLATTTLRY